MNAEQFGRLMAELQEIKSLLADKEASEPVLRWFKSSYCSHWWAGPVAGNFETAKYSTEETMYYPTGGEDCVSLVGRDLYEEAPLAFAVGAIFSHAATNGIRIEPFPWHLINEE